LSGASLILRLTGIAVVVAAVAGAFAYVNGTFDPQRLTPKKLINVLETNNGVHPGFRRNHSKGVCVIGHFESSGEARSYSSAQVFNEARTPVVGRFALPAGNPYAPDSAVPIRSGLAVHPGQRPAMAHRDEQHAGVPGGHARGVLSIAASPVAGSGDR
jgi:catalase